MVEGEGGISAKVVAASTANDTRITTLQLRYPRFIHAEFMTHRMFSRNAASNRAIPVSKNIEKVSLDPAEPVFWGLNQKGMQASEEADEETQELLEDQWITASRAAVFNARELNHLEAHKQIVNRVLEPFQFIDVLVTATEWDNFFNLRLHEDAQPEIYELARVMKEAMNRPGDVYQINPRGWHMPYITGTDALDMTSDIEVLAKVSAARCARVSYRNHDQSEPDFDKDLALANMLLENGHMSPFEHQARPMRDVDLATDNIKDLTEGETHIDKKGNIWSNNFRGWIQHRALL